MTEEVSEVFATALNEALVGENKHPEDAKKDENKQENLQSPAEANHDEAPVEDKQEKPSDSAEEEQKHENEHNENEPNQEKPENENQESPNKTESSKSNSEKSSSSSSPSHSSNQSDNENNNDDSKEKDLPKNDNENNESGLALSNVIKDKLDGESDSEKEKNEFAPEENQEKQTSQQSTPKQTSFPTSETNSPKSEKSSQRSNTSQKKEIPKKLTWVQEQQRIPERIRTNKYVARRINAYSYTCNVIPRAAATSSSEYRSKSREVVLDDFTQSLLSDKQPEEDPSIEQLRASAYQLRRLEQQKVNEQKYMEACKASEANEYVNRKMKETKHFNSSKEYIQDLITKRNELAALLEYISQKYDKDLEAQVQQNVEREQQIRESQAKEVEDFDASVPTELQPLFKRNSVTYWKLRSEEKNLALNKKFDEAQKKKEKADQLEQIEDQENYEKMSDFYKNKREKLLELHVKALNNFQQNADARLLKIHAEKAKALAPMQQRCQMIENLVEKLCAKKGIKAQQLDFESVDENRVEMLKKTEVEGILIPKRSQTSMSCRTAPIHKPKLHQSTKV